LSSEALQERAAERRRPFIFGYTCVNDVTAAEVLNENVDFPQWCRSKGYAPSAASAGDCHGLGLVTCTGGHRLDGVERQNYPLSDMIMPPEELVSRISHTCRCCRAT